MTGDHVAGTSVPRPAPARLSATDAGPALDRLADLARRLLATSSAQVCLAGDVHVVAGGAGLDAVTASGAVDASLCSLAVRTGAPVVAGDARADERLRDLPPVASGAVRALLSVPLITDGDGPIGALSVFSAEPRTWADGDPALLEQLALSVVAELELSALTAEYQSSLDRWGLAVDAAGVGSFDWDLRTAQLSWDDRLLSMFGYTGRPETFGIDDFTARLHPDDIDRVSAALQTSIDTCGVYDAEYRVVRPDGTTRWVRARGRALRGEDGAASRLIGAAYDTTDVHEGEARVARLLESMSAAFFVLDRDWRFSYVNSEAERVLGTGREQLLGGQVWELFPAAVGSEFEVQYRGAVATGTPRTFEAYYSEPLEAWYEVRAWPGPDGLSVSFLDVTDRHEAQARAARAVRRSELVADVTTGLSDTLDAEEAVARLAHLLVPELADWCLVTLVTDDGELRDVGWAHADPAMQATTERYSALRQAALTSASFVARTMATGQPSVIDSGATAAISAVIAEGEARELLQRLAPDAGAILPMQARGRTVGLLSIFNGPERGRYDDGDIATARDVAARAALALDNARLFQQQRVLAEELQRSLLTPPPEPDHLQVAVRYAPAAEAAQVGGDWYDAFLQPSGTTVLVIGDVVGHDIAAAAAMGQVRGLLRGIAFTTEQGPAHVLQRLDAAIEGLQVATNATAVVARLEQDADDRAAGVTHVRWSNAGHPPPMALTTDGEVVVLGDDGEADLLLGIDARSPRAEHLLTLRRGSTLLLYTDGLVERRGQSLDEGLERLRAALLELGHLPLEALCDALLQRLLPSRSDDDVALVAVRLHPQDRPRPAEAGPERLPPEVPREP